MAGGLTCTWCEILCKTKKKQVDVALVHGSSALRLNVPGTSLRQLGPVAPLSQDC
jgi:hypothetical protein